MEEVIKSEFFLLPGGNTQFGELAEHPHHDRDQEDIAREKREVEFGEGHAMGKAYHEKVGRLEGLRV